MSMPSLPHNGGSSKSLLMFGSDAVGPLTSAPNQLVSNLFFFFFFIVPLLRFQARATELSFTCILTYFMLISFWIIFLIS